MKTSIAITTLALLLAPLGLLQAQQAHQADAEFLSKVIPSIASSVTIIDYAQKHAADDRVREFAGRVLKQHKESVEIARGHAKRLHVDVVGDGEKDSQQTLEEWSKLKGSDLDAEFLKWLAHIHHDTSLFDNEVKNGTDAEVKTYAQNSIIAGNEHHKEAGELLEKLRK